MIADAGRGTLADAGVARLANVDGVVSATSGHVIRQLGGQPCWSSDAGAGNRGRDRRGAGEDRVRSVRDGAGRGGAGRQLLPARLDRTVDSANERIHRDLGAVPRPSSSRSSPSATCTSTGTTPESMAEVASAIPFERSDELGGSVLRSRGHAGGRPQLLGWSPTPSTSLDICMTSEGGAGMLLTTVGARTRARRHAGLIHGGALEKQGARTSSRRVGRFGWSGRWAGEKAFGMGRAGAVGHGCLLSSTTTSSFDVIRLFEAYGFCGEGEGGDFVMDGRVRIDGRCRICTDGGLMSYSHNAGSQALQRPIAGVLQNPGSGRRTRFPTWTSCSPRTTGARRCSPTA